ncbi:hypothetical protein [Wenyingzhuangia sp. IMCC45574]
MRRFNLQKKLLRVVTHLVIISFLIKFIFWLQIAYRICWISNMNKQTMAKVGQIAEWIDVFNIVLVLLNQILILFKEKNIGIVFVKEKTKKRKLQYKQWCKEKGFYVHSIVKRYRLHGLKIPWRMHTKGGETVGFTTFVFLG